MKRIIYFLILVFLNSCTDKNSTGKMNMSNKPINKSPEATSDTNKKLFLSYKTLMSEDEFNNTTNELISQGLIEKRKNGFDQELFYLFPYCEGSVGRVEGESYSKYKVTPVFQNGRLVCIKINDLQSGAYSKQNFGNRNYFTSCILTAIIQKYKINYVSVNEEFISYSKVAMYNDEYDPINELNVYSGNIYNRPKKVDLPSFLVDKSKFLIPGEKIEIYNKRNVPNEIKPIVLINNDMVIILSYNWIWNVTSSYSLWETKEYQNLNLDLKMKYLKESIQNSKQKIFTTDISLRINLDYMTYEYYKSKYLKTPKKKIKRRKSRDVSKEL